MSINTVRKLQTEHKLESSSGALHSFLTQGWSGVIRKAVVHQLTTDAGRSFQPEMDKTLKNPPGEQNPIVSSHLVGPDKH